MQSGAIPLAITLSPPEVAVAPGGPPVEIMAAVHNMGSEVDQYSIVVEGLPPEWWSAPVSAVALFPGDSIPLAISLHPPADGSAQLGRYPFTVRAYSTTDPALVATATGAVQLGVGGAPALFRLEIAPKRVTAHNGKYRVSIANGGREPLHVGLGGRDERSALVYSFANPQVMVPPGGRVTVPLSVKPRQAQMIGGENRRYTFTVGAQPLGGGNVREDTADLVHTPRFAIWALAALVALVVLLPLAGFLLWRSLSGGDATSLPAITEPTSQAALPTLTGGLETPTDGGTPTPQPEECKLWVMEHRGDRGTEFPPGLASDLQYQHHNRSYQYKSVYISNLVVSQTGVISDVNVGRIDLFRAAHQRDEAILGTLISPTGTEVQLFSWECIEDTGGSKDVSMHITLDNAAEGHIPYSCTGNFSGVFKPDFDNLSRLDGEQARGNWILQLDRYTDDENPGSFFNKWELDICTLK